MVREANAQDAAAVRVGAGRCGRPFAVGVVADGCGSGARSEVGATLLAEAVARESARRLAAGTTAVEVAGAAGRVGERVLAAVLHAVGRDSDDRTRFLADHLLATLIVLVDDGEHLAVVAFGDGLLAADGDVLVIDEGNTPSYLGYALAGRALPAPSFIWTRRSRDVRQVAIATDGLLPELAAGLWGHRGRSLQRWLNVQAHRAPLEDDATVVVLEREERAS